MKIRMFILLALLAFNSCATQIDQATVYDEELAATLGADDLGMKKYVMAFLKAGPYRDQNPEVAAEIQKGHMDHIKKLSESGKLVLAGPFLDSGPIRGIFLFDTDSMEEAMKLTEEDPAVKAGRLAVDLHPWYGSAALMKVNEIHSTLTRSN